GAPPSPRTGTTPASRAGSPPRRPAADAPTPRAHPPHPPLRGERGEGLLPPAPRRAGGQPSFPSGRAVYADRAGGLPRFPAPRRRRGLATVCRRARIQFRKGGLDLEAERHLGGGGSDARAAAPKLLARRARRAPRRRPSGTGRAAADAAHAGGA